MWGQVKCPECQNNVGTTTTKNANGEKIKILNPHKNKQDKDCSGRGKIVNVD